MSENKVFLLVEGHRPIRTTLEDMLIAEGYRVLVASDETEAEKILGGEDIDGAIIGDPAFDHWIPEIGSQWLPFVKKLQDMFPDAPIISFSVDAYSGGIPSLAKFNIQKPDTVELRKIVQKIKARKK